MTEEQINNNFRYHRPTSAQQEKYVTLRDEAKELALKINELCPDSREKFLAFSKLEEAVMWANASIARNGDEEPHH